MQTPAELIANFSGTPAFRHLLSSAEDTYDLTIKFFKKLSQGTPEALNAILLDSNHSEFRSTDFPTALHLAVEKNHPLGLRILKALQKNPTLLKKTLFQGANLFDLAIERKNNVMAKEIIKSFEEDEKSFLAFFEKSNHKSLLSITDTTVFQTILDAFLSIDKLVYFLTTRIEHKSSVLEKIINPKIYAKENHFTTIIKKLNAHPDQLINFLTSESFRKLPGMNDTKISFIDCLLMHADRPAEDNIDRILFHALIQALTPENIVLLFNTLDTKDCEKLFHYYTRSHRVFGAKINRIMRVTLHP